jgi:hypothetical protein
VTSVLTCEKMSSTKSSRHHNRKVSQAGGPPASHAGALASVQIGLRSRDRSSRGLGRVGKARSLGETAVVIHDGDGSGRRL